MAEDKQIKIEGLTPEAPVVEVENEIFTMPREFYEPLQKSGSNKLKIIIIAVTVLVVFGSATAYVLLVQKPFSEESLPVGGDNSSAVGIGAEKEDEVLEPAASKPAGEDVSTSTENFTENADGAAGSPEKISEDGFQEDFDPILPSSVDLDRDGLTDIEEILLGTDPALADTDHDGFTDGSEIKAGFDPTRPTADLSASPLWQTYINSKPKFKLRLPASWEETRETADPSRVRFLALNNDEIIIELYDNAESLSLDAWFKENYPLKDAGRLKNKVIDKEMALVEPNGQAVYVSLDKTVLRLSYTVNSKLEKAYPAIWEFLLNSFSKE